MSIAMPHFKYRFVDRGNRRVLCIEEGGKVIHEISDLADFYRTFGYDPESLHLDMLPDEFIWSEYVNNAAADFTPCIQMHIVNYLKLHSEAFNTAYGAVYDKLVAMHEELKASRGSACFACTKCGAAVGEPGRKPGCA